MTLIDLTFANSAPVLVIRRADLNAGEGAVAVEELTPLFVQNAELLEAAKPCLEVSFGLGVLLQLQQIRFARGESAQGLAELDVGIEGLRKGEFEIPKLGLPVADGTSCDPEESRHLFLVPAAKPHHHQER